MVYRFGLATELSLTFTQWFADGVLGLGKKGAVADDVPSIITSLGTEVFQLALTPM